MGSSTKTWRQFSNSAIACAAIATMWLLICAFPWQALERLPPQILVGMPHPLYDSEGCSLVVSQRKEGVTASLEQEHGVGCACSKSLRKRHWCNAALVKTLISCAAGARLHIAATTIVNKKTGQGTGRPARLPVLHKSLLIASNLAKSARVMRGSLTKATTSCQCSPST